MGSYTASDALRLIGKCSWRSGEMDEPDYTSEILAVQLLQEVNPIKRTSSDSWRFSAAALWPGWSQLRGSFPFLWHLYFFLLNMWNSCEGASRHEADQQNEMTKKKPSPWVCEDELIVVFFILSPQWRTPTEVEFRGSSILGLYRLFQNKVSTVCLFFSPLLPIVLHAFGENVTLALWMWVKNKQTNVFSCPSDVDVIEPHSTWPLRVETQVQFPCGLPLLLGQVLPNVVHFEGKKKSLRDKRLFLKLPLCLNQACKWIWSNWCLRQSC